MYTDDNTVKRLPMTFDEEITWEKQREMDKLVDQFTHILRHKDLKDYNLNYVYHDRNKKHWVIEFGTGGYMELPYVYVPYRKYMYFFTEDRLREFLENNCYD